MTNIPPTSASTCPDQCHTHKHTSARAIVMGALKLMPNMGNTGSMNAVLALGNLQIVFIINAQNNSKKMWTNEYMGFLSVTSACKKMDAN